MFFITSSSCAVPNPSSISRKCQINISGILFQAPLGAQERGGGEAVPSGEPAAGLPLRTGVEGHLQGRVQDHVEEVVGTVLGNGVQARLIVDIQPC